MGHDPDFLSKRSRRALDREFARLDRDVERRLRKSRRGAPVGPRDWAPTRSRRRLRPSPVVSVLVVLGALLGAQQLASSMPSTPSSSTSIAGLLDRVPGLAPTPLGTPGGLGATGTHAFLSTTEGGDPVAWDPCSPIHYVVGGTAPAGAELMVADALEEVSAASGYQFVHDGTTTEPPGGERDADLYDADHPPLLVSWTGPDQVADLVGGTIGTGGPASAHDRDGDLYYVSGVVNLDAAQFQELMAQDPSGLRVVVLHELGHALGLGHVDDPDQVMHTEGSASAGTLGGGDLEGLAALGSVECASGL